MKIRGTDFIMFHVSDLGAAARFYRDDLGLKQEVYSEQYQWAEFDCGNVTLALKGGTAPSAILAGSRLARAVDDVSAAHAELTAKGARLAGPPQDHGCSPSLARKFHTLADVSYTPRPGGHPSQEGIQDTAYKNPLLERGGAQRRGVSVCH